MLASFLHLPCQTCAWKLVETGMWIKKLLHSLVFHYSKAYPWSFTYYMLFKIAFSGKKTHEESSCFYKDWLAESNQDVSSLQRRPARCSLEIPHASHKREYPFPPEHHIIRERSILPLNMDVQLVLIAASCWDVFIHLEGFYTASSESCLIDTPSVTYWD